MSYIRKVIGADEKLLLVARAHWIYLLEGFLWLAGFAIIGTAVSQYLHNYYNLHDIKFHFDLWIFRFDERHIPITWVFAAIGFLIFLPLFMAYLSSEIGLTNRRLIYKKGLMFIEIEQVELEDIKAEHVIHGWLGWLLGYGRIHFDCRFVDDVWIPAIRDPYRLVKASHTARMKHIHMTDYTHEILEANLQRIEKKRQEARLEYQFRKLRDNVKTGFRKAA